MNRNDRLSNSAAEDLGRKVETLERRKLRFASITDQFRPRMLMRARQIAPSWEEAEDIVQEAYLKALRGLPNFRGDSKMESWLYSIVRNAALEHLRDGKRRGYGLQASVPSDDDDQTMFEIPDTRADPEEACARKEREQILFAEIEKLDSCCKRTLQMCFLNETPYQVAADSLGVCISTVKSRVFRGKQLLKKALSPCIVTDSMHHNPPTDRLEKL